MNRTLNRNRGLRRVGGGLWPAALKRVGKNLRAALIRGAQAGGIALALALPTVAPAQLPFGGDSSVPIHIQAENAIELHQEEKAYVARGKARAVRGEVTVTSQVLVAYYREAPAGGNQVYRLVAQGDAHIQTPAQNIYGDRAIYDTDQKLLLVTGEDLRLVTREDVVTARDSLEYYEEKELAVARGNAVATRGDRRLTADVLLGQFAKNAAGESEMKRLDGRGHVVITTPQEVARADSFVYRLDSELATLIDNVRITRGDNHIRGEAAEMNMTTKVSRVIAAPGKRVTGILVRGKDDDRSDSSADKASSAAGSGPDESARPESRKALEPKPAADAPKKVAPPSGSGPEAIR